jgi:signal transduction histidine kinase
MPTSQFHRNRPILIVADDPSFVRNICERWEQQPGVATVRIVASHECVGCQLDDFQFVVVGGLEPGILREVLAVLRPGNVPVIIIGADGASIGVSERNASKLLVLPVCPSWQDLLIALGAEVARRAEAQARARRSEMTNAALQCDATLGRYVVDMRHNLNNALTSVLGNAELLLLDETKFTSMERKQIDTIRLMALRMHETLQRFSSLEKELRGSSEPQVGAVAEHTAQDFKTQDRKTSEGLQGPQLAQAAGAD